MMRFTRFAMAAAMTTATFAMPAAAQQSAATMPIRKLAAPVHVSSVTFTNAQHVRQLSDGRLLVNDGARRQVLLLDSTLANPIVVIDSAVAKENSYGARAGGLIAYRADSTLFVDPVSSTFLVIDPSGKLARVMALPYTASASALSLPTTYGYPGFSEAFGLLYAARTSGLGRAMNQSPVEGAPEVVIKYEDSTSVLGMKIETRKPDTLATFGAGNVTTMRMSYQSMSMSTSATSGMWPVFDDWTMMSDGSLALFSGREYRLRFVNTDRSKTEGPRIPYPWHHVDDDEKTHIADSINTLREKNYQDQLDSYNKAVEKAAHPEKKDSAAKKDGTAPAVAAKDAPVPVPSGRAGGPLTMTTITSDGVRMVTPMAPRPPTRQAKIEITDIPDYMPATERSTTTLRADADNRVWIRPRQVKPVPGAGPIYDIANRKGELIDRVQLPVGRTLLGFGSGGAIYLLARDAGQVRIEKVMFR